MTIASLKGPYELPALCVPAMKVEKLLMVVEELCMQHKLQSVIYCVLMFPKLGLCSLPITETLESETRL